MSDSRAETVSDPLVLFCQDFLSSSPQGPPFSEDALARGFISRFPVASFLMKGTAEALCAKLSIDVYYRELPSDLTGFNGVYGEKREIILSESEDPLGISTHTLYHEIREIIERVFINLGYPTIVDAEKEKRAEEFAIAVRTNSAIKESEFLWDVAFNITSDWLRWISLAALASLIFLEGISIHFLPQMEKMSQKT